MYLNITECKDKGGISVNQGKKIKLDLRKITANYEVLLETPILIVINYNGEIVVRDYGELLFKELKDKNEIKKIANEIYEAGK